MGFERLSPALQYQIVNELRWPALRPVQEQAIAPILDGRNCVILAPTAGGKTEAAILPVLSLMDAEDRPPVSALYIAPLRALLNNLEPRLEALSALVGRRAFKWHGDVGQRARRRFVRDLGDLLAITPESLEAMLISASAPRQRILGNLQVVIIDEVHSFAADDRGGHLVALLERISRICGRDLQRIGLSATVGNPQGICDWLSGSSRRERAVVDASSGSREADVALDYVGSSENAAVMIERLHPGRKRLVFADSRRRVEELGRLLDASGVEVHVTHSSLAASERNAAERAFSEGQSCAIVATSALELGIDIGDLDHVLQIDAPATVASFLQRMGRTGRRAGTRANCTFLAIDDVSLLQAAALLRLYRRGFVEPVAPVRRASHLLAHQLLALSLQHQGVPRGEWWDWVAGAAPFADLSAEDRAELVDSMQEKEILVEADGRILLGEAGEKLYGRRHFMELYAVFTTPPIFTVIAGAHEVGTLDAYFVMMREAEELVFVLAGSAWRVKEIDWRRGLCYVEPSPAGRLPTWMGEPRLLSYELCQAVRSVLMDDEEDACWSRRARELVKMKRAELSFVRDEPMPITLDGVKLRVWTFAGGRINNTLARLLEHKLGGQVSASNIAVAVGGEAAQSTVAIRQALRELAAPGAWDEELARRLAGGCARGRLSKFRPCLSERLELLLLRDSLMDVEGTRRVLSGV